MPMPESGRKIRQEFLLRMDRDGIKPLRDHFIEWVRLTYKGDTYSPHWWPKIRRREALTYDFVARLKRYLVEVMGVAVTLEEMAEPTPEVPKLVSIGTPKDNFWACGWVRLFTGLPENLFIPQECYASEGEVSEIALMILENLGRKQNIPVGKSIAPERAISLGEKAFDISRADYITWLLRFWRRDPLTVLFVNVPGPTEDSPMKRVGCYVTIPLAEERGNKFRHGEIGLWDLSDADYCRPSRWLHAHACSEVRLSLHKPDKLSSMAQGHTGLYQHAAFCPPVTGIMDGPIGVTVAVNPENTLRAKKYGYSENGVICPRPKVPILELSPPPWPRALFYPGRCLDYAHYRVLCSVFGLYQDKQADAEDAQLT